MSVRTSESLQRHIERGTTGVAGRAASNVGKAAAGRATVRSALKRVGAAPKAAPAGSASDQQKKARRSSQAALGMMGRAPIEFDDDTLKQWLGGLGPAELKKLAHLVWAARQNNQTEEKPKGFDQVERQLQQQGVKLDINAQHVTVNIGGNGRSGAPYNNYRRNSYRPDWGRQWGRVKDFINGH